MKIHFSRTAVGVGLAGLFAAAALVATQTPAIANVGGPNGQGLGQKPGALILNPSSGVLSDMPAYRTTEACPTGFQGAGQVAVIDNNGQNIYMSGNPGPTVINNPAGWTGNLTGSMFDALDFASHNTDLGLPLLYGQTFEFVFECRASLSSFVWYHSTFVTYDADQVHWTSSPTPPPPVQQVQNTTTTLTAQPNPAPEGAGVTLSANVTAANNSAVSGQVEFFDGIDSLGTAPVVGGTASLVVSALPLGDRSITAKFQENASFHTSTSSAVIVTITSASTTGVETLNFNLQAIEGVLRIQVDPTPVTLGAASHVGTTFQSTGSLSPVFVIDERQQTRPGWHVTGTVTDFAGSYQGSSVSFSGTNLGWIPQVVSTQDAATAAGPVAPGATPGLKGGANLATAAADHGLGQSELDAALNLVIPDNTRPTTYTATLTLTAISGPGV
jgi:hypothetical protein